jgi:hypothetical protein
MLEDLFITGNDISFLNVGWPVLSAFFEELPDELTGFGRPIADVYHKDIPSYEETIEKKKQEKIDNNLPDVTDRAERWFQTKNY